MEVDGLLRTSSLASSSLGRRGVAALFDQKDRVFDVEIPLGEGYKSISCKFRPIFAKRCVHRGYPVPQFRSISAAIALQGVPTIISPSSIYPLHSLTL